MGVLRLMEGDQRPEKTTRPLQENVRPRQNRHHSDTEDDGRADAERHQDGGQQTTKDYANPHLSPSVILVKRVGLVKILAGSF